MSLAAAPIGTSSLRLSALARAAELASRYPDAFAVSWRRRAAVVLTIALAVGLAWFALNRFEFSLVRLIAGSTKLGQFAVLMLPPSSGGHAMLFIKSLGETLAIALLGTLTAAALALPFGFLAAKTVIPNAVVHFVTRRCLDTIRGVDTLIWALIWINVVGLGPFAGVLAIASSDFGAFAKLFSEAVEAADRKAVEGVQSVGGSGLHGVRFGILPQVLPLFASQVLYYFESNTRSATIIGIVGAGGIGLHLAEQIRVLEMPQVAFLVLMILVTVAAIDLVSSKIRFAIIGAPPRHG